MLEQHGKPMHIGDRILELEKRVEELTRERDEARAQVARLRSTLEMFVSWCPTPHSPDECRVAECRYSRNALAITSNPLDAVREAQRELGFIAGGCLVPPDGGSPDIGDAMASAKAAIARLNETFGEAE